MKNERVFSVFERCILVLIIAISVTSFVVYIVQLHGKPLADSPTDFGVFGDYVGGVLGSLISLISIVLLYRTYRTQLDITNKQEEQLAIQQFESTFFALLNNQRTILMSCKGAFYDNKSTQREGNILCDYQYIDQIADELRLQMLNFEYDSTLLEARNINLLRIMINDYYLEVFNKHIPQLSHYFRHLYHMLKYVDCSAISDKKRYFDLIQAQMSNNELYIAFYNGISIYGRKRMHPLMERYSFLENLKDDDLTLKKHRELFYPKTKFKDYMNNSRNIIFIGGVHGVGKGYLCSNIVQIFEIVHLSSSDVLNWRKGVDKGVENVNYTQNYLIQNLKKIVSPDERYLLDGHFCLLKTDGSIERIPLNTFREINPILIILVIAPVNIIKERLEQRDNKNYDFALLDKFQRQEIEYAHEVSDELGIECVQLMSNDVEILRPIITKLFFE